MQAPKSNSSCNCATKSRSRSWTRLLTSCSRVEPPLEALQFALKFKDKFLEVLDLEATLLNLDFEVDVLFEGGIDLVWGELGEMFFLSESMCCYYEMLELSFVEIV